MNKRRKRKQRMIKLLAAGILVVAVLAVVLLFQVRTVTVYGNDRHSSEEISSGLMNEILSKNTLYLLWKYRDGEVPDTLPFLNSLQVQMKTPSHIEVVVQEKELVGYIDKEQYVYFDRDGVVLQMTDEEYLDVPIITGIGTEEPVLYQKLPTESSAQLRTILSLTQLLTYHELTASEIRFSENMDITVFIGNIEVMLGQDEYLEEKMANLKAILSSMDGTEYGTLHLESFTGGTMNVTFTPKEAPVPETAADESSDGMGTDDIGTAEGAGLDDADTADGTGTDDTGTADGMGMDDTDTADGTGTDGTDTADGTDGDGTGADADGGTDGMADETADTAEDTSSGEPFMAFDSSGTLRYDVRVVNGQAVDSTGAPVPGCSVNENGYVVDAFMNVIDPATGQPIQ